MNPANAIALQRLKVYGDVEPASRYSIVTLQKVDEYSDGTDVRAVDLYWARGAKLIFVSFGFRLESMVSFEFRSDLRDRASFFIGSPTLPLTLDRIENALAWLDGWLSLHQRYDWKGVVFPVQVSHEDVLVGNCGGDNPSMC